MKYVAALMITILLHGSAFGFVGMRPYGADNIGSLREDDSIPIDRIDEVGQKKTTPLDIYNFVFSMMNGAVAPASHVHALATQSSDGFQSASDKLKLDTAAITAKGAGAVADGTWHSLSSLGYTVDTARAKWPYLTNTGALSGTHIIQTAADLSSYGADWCALQNAANQYAGGLVLVNNGTYLVERSVTVGSSTTLAGMSKGAIILPHTTWTGAKNIFTVAVNASYPRITGLTINENPWPALNSGQFTGVYVNSGTYLASVTDCNLGGFSYGAFVMPSSQFEFIGNHTNDVRQDVWFAKGSSSDSHWRLIVDRNVFMHTYRGGITWSVYVEDEAQCQEPRITNNEVYYNSLYHHYASTKSGEGNSMFTDISDNYVVGNINGQSPLIYYVANVGYGTKINNNMLWGRVGIGVGGQQSVSITGSTGVDTHSEGGCFVSIYAPVIALSVTGVAGNATGGQYSVCGDYSLAGIGQLPSATTETLVTISGNAVDRTSEVSTNVDYIRFRGDVDKPAIGITGTLPPDVGTVLNGGSSDSMTLCKTTRVLLGKRLTYINAGSGAHTVNAPSGSTMINLAGSSVSSVSVPANSYAEFVVNANSKWQQLK